MRKIERVLRDMNGKQYIVKDLDDSFHTANDSIKKEELQKTGLIMSEKGKKYFCLKSHKTFLDYKKNPFSYSSYLNGVLFVKIKMNLRTSPMRRI